MATTPATTPEPFQQVAIALGSNLGASRTTLDEALERNEGVRVIRRSSWYRSAPIGPVQPDYVNGCALLEVSLAPEALLDVLQATENLFGRVRAERWGPRTLDLDLILYGLQRIATERLEVPHPRMAERPRITRTAIAGGPEAWLAAVETALAEAAPAAPTTP